MESIKINIKYGGVPVEVVLYPEEDFRGVIYPVEMEGTYFFTLYLNEEEEWDITRESNGQTPQVEDELFNEIVKKLEYELRYAA